MILYIIILCLINSSVELELRELNIKLRSSVDSIGQSFIKLIEDIKNFFICKYEAILHRREITKGALHKFISDSFNKSAIKTCSKYTEKKNTTKQTVRKTSKFVPKFTQFRQNYNIEMTKIINLHGYRLETHTVLTADGYLLTLHRMLLHDSDRSKSKKVLLHHGLLGSSLDWVLLGSNRALPYLLWLSGYDVWLTNARGNRYSKTHTRLSVNSVDFWDFSFHEIGIYDLPAVIDYIKEICDSNAELHYVGYSMGGTSLLVLLSTYPQYNNILKSAILLAPLAFMYDIKGPLRYFSHINKYGYIGYLGDKEFPSNGSIPDEVVNKFCTDITMCLNPIFLIANGGKNIVNQELRSYLLSHASGEGSAKTIKHYIQSVNSGEFQMFDYGTDENLKKYGVSTPPAYRLNDVTLPVALITSSHDWLCTISDISSLLPFFSKPIAHHLVKNSEFSHTDFLWAEDAPQVVYSIVLSILLDPRAPKFQNENIVSKRLN